mgnify:CR=1 FL=1
MTWNITPGQAGWRNRDSNDSSYHLRTEELSNLSWEEGKLGHVFTEGVFSDTFTHAQ